MNLSKLTSSELRKLDTDIAAQIKNRQKGDIATARTEIRAIAQRAGISLSDLAKDDSPRKKSAEKSPKNSAMHAKFQNPNDTSQQWSGRGRPPKWVKDWTSEGKSMDSLKG